ncbi:Ig-like domain-containing protein [Vibrio atlanticus]|uniref:Ig-like domain-containing protein n=1 Tax=Vibrio atlanticus TaxID=693153 RepID=A0ABV4KRI3_9VIBR
MNKILSLCFVVLAVVMAGGCKDSKNEGHKPMVYNPTKASPPDLSVAITVNGKKRTLELHRYSIREPDMKVYLWDHRINGNAPSSTINTPAIRVYRGVDTSDENTQVIAALTSKNKLYVTAFRGSQRVWTIEKADIISGLSAKKLTATAQNLASVTPQSAILDNMQKAIKTVDEHPSAPTSGLDNLIAKDKTQVQLHKVKVAVHVSYQAFVQEADSNLDDAMVLVDYYINLVDYVLSRDALLRFSVNDVLIETWGYLDDHYQTCKKSASHDACKTWGYQHENEPIRVAAIKWWDEQRKTRGWDLKHRMLWLKGNWILGVNFGSIVRSPGDIIGADGVVLHETAHYLGTGHSTSAEGHGIQGGEAHVDDINFNIYKNNRLRRNLVGSADYPLPPSAKIDHFSVKRDSTTALDVMKNDVDANGDKISIHNVDKYSAQGAELSITNGKVTYKAPKGFIGEDEFHYIITDGKKLFDRDVVHVKVTTPDLYARFDFEDAPVDDLWMVNAQTGLAGQVAVVKESSKQEVSEVWVNQGYANSKTLKLGAYESVKSNLLENDVQESYKYKFHYGHDFDFGEDDFTLSLKVKPKVKLEHPIDLVSKGIWVDGFQLKLTNEGTLEWFMISRQLAAYAGGSDLRKVSVTTKEALNLSQWNTVAVRVDRTTQKVSIWVNGKQATLVNNYSRSKEESDDMELADGYAGVWGAGSRLSAGTSQGLIISKPWMDAGKDATANIKSEQKAGNILVDNIEMRSFALSDGDMVALANDSLKYAYTPRPYNGQSFPFKGNHKFTWKVSKSSAYKVYTSTDNSTWLEVQSGASSAASGSHTVNLDPASDVLYWRIDFDGKTGKVWSVRNSLKTGIQNLSFSYAEANSGANYPQCTVTKNGDCLFGWDDGNTTDQFNHSWTQNPADITNWEGHLYLGGEDKKPEVSVTAESGQSWKAIRFRAAVIGKGWTGAQDVPKGTLKLFANGTEVWKAYSVGDNIIDGALAKSGNQWSSLPSIGSSSVSVPRGTKVGRYGIHQVDLPDDTTTLKWVYEVENLDSKGKNPGVALGGVQLLR